MKTAFLHSLKIYGLLLLLLVLNTGSAFLPLHGWNWIFSLILSISMTTLILMFFMRLRQSEPLLWLTAAAGFLWLGILLFLVILDYLSRPWT